MQYFKNLLAISRKPFYGEIPMFDSRQDMSFIPDGGTRVITDAPVESPDGSRTTFTFTAAPKYIWHNGQWLLPTTDFTVSGAQATLLNVVPQTGAILKAVI